MKACIFLLIVAVLAGMPLHGQIGSGCPVRPATLKSMRDCYRPVLVFAPAARDAVLAAQQALFEQYADDMMDRDLLYVPVLVESAHFKPPLDAPYVLLKQSEMNAIRERFQIGATEFVTVLVGKDGGEKFRTKRPVSVLHLDELVDSMPMGSREKSARAARSR